MKHTRLPKEKCPACGYEMDCLSQVDGGNADPKPGDLALCLSCGEPLCLTDKLERRSATTEDLLQLDGEERAALARIQVEIRRRRASDPSWPKGFDQVGSAS